MKLEQLGKKASAAVMKARVKNPPLKRIAHIGKVGNIGAMGKLPMGGKC